MVELQRLVTNWFEILGDKRVTTENVLLKLTEAYLKSRFSLKLSPVANYSICSTINEPVLWSYVMS